MNENFEKVLFVQKTSDEEFETEGLWCIKNEEYYIIDSIPFIAKRVALGDTVKAEYDSDEKAYYFDDFVKVSGNSTIRVFVTDERVISECRSLLGALGCETEAFLERNIIAVNIPENINYLPVKKFLEKGEIDGKWQYEEACLCHKY